jgi:DNA-binding CsgD family transcriptional regulator
LYDLGRKDLWAALEVVRLINDDQHVAEVSRQALVRLNELVGSESLCYARADLSAGRLLSAIHEPAETDIIGAPGFHAAFEQHPAFDAYRSGRVVMGTSTALTDLADPPTLRRLAIYVDYQRPHGINDQLMCIIHQGGRQGTVMSFNRERRGFSRRERAIVDLVIPHLSQAVARQQRLAMLRSAVHSVSHHRVQISQAEPRLALLTAREHEIVKHVVSGLTDREISRSMAISSRTVHKHLESIYRKLGIGSRTSLIALVHQMHRNSFQADSDPEPGAAVRRVS